MVSMRISGKSKIRITLHIYMIVRILVKQSEIFRHTCLQIKLVRHCEVPVTATSMNFDFHL